MNRKTKGALAVGAGAIILLGGAGSFALWSDTEDIAGGNITAGDFGLDCGTDGAWTDKSPTMNGGTAVDPAADLMVPGDIWEYAGNCTVKATGKNIAATLGVDLGTANVPSDNFAVTTTVNGTDTTTTPISVTNGQSLPVAVRVNFLESTPNLEDVHAQVTVSGMKITLNQVRPS
ncbi:alternate-type signal peptide domain-containing protein [Gordonia liuliyuniae]|uniref:Alternate-type signal peptide domain-containing protein n=1 Tax=Gordonia liuliyuniae TaxID=2911517 RepID=A0ABS9IWP1_9ACTN|nr:alternate-type signal peptide domain-containing protein [Gordonia liuliyuniae]MCF8589974.1 alternate-type signal peptide domain-containing protein [Gordonia liuliyuniae]